MAEEVGGIVGTISLEAEGLDAQLAKLKAAMDQVQKELEDLHAGFDVAGKSAAATGMQIGDLAAKELHLKGEIERVTAAMQQQATATVRVDAAMAGVGRSAGAGFGMASNKLLQFGNTLDDLQYVGEMGLRPIINNIMQISPAAGIALLAFDQLRKHGDALAPAALAVGEYWLGSFKEMEGGTKGVVSALREVQEGLKATVKWVGELGEGWDAMTKKRETAEAKKIEAFTSVGTTADQARGKALAGAIDEYGRKRFIDEAVGKRGEIDPLLRAGDKAAVREEQARILELLDRAKKGDRNAIAALEARTGGTGVREKIREAMPEAKEARKDQEEEDRRDQAESDRRLTARRAARRRDEQQEEGFGEQENARDQAEGQRRLGRRKQQHLRAREEAKKEAGERAIDRMPGLDAGLEGRYTAALAARGGDAEKARQDVQADLYRELIGQGVDPESAKRMATERSRGAMRGVNERIMGLAMGGEGGPVRRSQVFDMADLNRRLQESVSGGDPALQVQKEMEKHLADVVRWTDRFGKMQPVKAEGQ